MDYDISKVWFFQKTDRKAKKSNWFDCRPVSMDIFQGDDVIFQWMGKSRARGPYVIHRIESCVDNTYLKIEPEYIGGYLVNPPKKFFYGVYDGNQKIDTIGIRFDMNQNPIEKYLYCDGMEYRILFKDGTVDYEGEISCVVPNICEFKGRYQKASHSIGGPYMKLVRSGEIKIFDSKYIWASVLLGYEYWYGLYKHVYYPNGTWGQWDNKAGQ